eukprot:jgi/Astpho2/2861/fgenesh1_pg.00050_%23_119_t
MPTSQSESWHAILVAVTASGLDIGALKAHAISQELVTALDISAVVASVEPASPLGAELAAAKAAGAADAPIELKVKAVQAQLPGFKDAALAAERARRSKAAEDAAAALQAAAPPAAGGKAAPGKAAEAGKPAAGKDAAKAVDAAAAAAAAAKAAEEAAAAQAAQAAAAADPVGTAQQTLEAAQKQLLVARTAHTWQTTVLSQPLHIQQVFWCDGLGSDAAALAGFADAGLPIRAVLHVHEDRTEASVLLTELRSLQAVAEPAAAVLDIAVLDIAAGATQGPYAPPASTPASDPTASTSAPAEAAAVAGPPGTAELVRALHMLAPQAARYDAWRQGAHVVAVGGCASEEEQLGYMKSLLDSIPQEQVSEAVLLHAMVAQLEQTLADPAALEADLQAGAEQAAAALLGVQLQGAGADGASLERPVHPGPGETAGVIQPEVFPLGDSAAARLAGLTTGVWEASGIQSPTSVLAGPDAGVGLGAGLAAAGIDVRAVEAHMQQLLKQWLGQGSLAYNLAAAGATRTLLEGHCGTLPVSMVQRYSQLKRAQTLLPAAVREVHGAALLQRHHVEELEGPAMLQALAQAFLVYPDVQVAAARSEEGRLMAFSAGSAQVDAASAMLPRLIPFAEHWEQLLSQGSCPDPPSQVFAVSRAAAGQLESRKLLYPSDGTIMSLDEAKHLCLFTGTTTVSLQQQLPARLVAATEGGCCVCLALSEASAAEQALGQKVEGPPECRLSCSTPGGLLLELTSLGQVIVSRAHDQQYRGAMPSGRGAAVHGAPVPSADMGAALARHEVAWRSGHLRVLQPDGALSEFTPVSGGGASGQGSWLYTTAAGKQRSEGSSTSVSGDDASQVAKQAITALDVVTVTDPDTGATVTTRSDLVMVFQYPTDMHGTPPEGQQPVAGARVVQDADGTRVTTWADGAWRVEALGMPPVLGDAAGIECQAAPGVELQWTSSNAALLAGLPGDVTLLGTGSTAALLPASQGPASAEAVAAMLLAATRAAQANADKRARLMVEAQKETNCANQAATEQYAAACAAYDAQVAEAQAAWEAAQKKKPKAKQKEEPNPPVPPPRPAEPVPQVASVPLDAMGVAQATAVASPGWYIADLVVGAFALHQRSGPAIALSAGGELSGWHPALAAGSSSRQGGHPSLSSSRGSQSSGHLQMPPSGVQRVAREAMSSQGSIGGRGSAARTASVAPPRTGTPSGRAPGAVGPTPRLLLLRPDGSGREVLDAAAFEAYRRQQAKDLDCHVSTSQLAGAEEPGAHVHTFLTLQRLRSNSVPELPVPSPALVRPACPARAVPALAQPSRFELPQVLELCMPRVAARIPAEQGPPPPAPVYTVRQVVEYAPVTFDLVATMDSVLQESTAREDQLSKLLQQNLGGAHTQSPQDAAAAAAISQRVAAMRQHRAAAAQQALAATPEVGPYDHTVRRPATGQPLAYWQAEEGMRALEADPLLAARQAGPGLKCQTRSLPKRQAGVYISSAAEPEENGQPREVATAPQGQQRPPASLATRSPRQAVTGRHAGRPVPTTLRAGGSRGARPGLTSVRGGATGYTPESSSSAQPAGGELLPMSTLMKTAAFDVYGNPRAVAPALPSAYMRQAAQMTVNDRWLDVNEDSMQLSRTSSATLVRLRGKGVSQFQLAPAHLHFGDVPLAEVARQAAVIKNVSTERARFTVLHPQDRALRVAYKPGPLAAGMETPITIEFRPQGCLLHCISCQPAGGQLPDKVQRGW